MLLLTKSILLKNVDLWASISEKPAHYEYTLWKYAEVWESFWKNVIKLT